MARGKKRKSVEDVSPKGNGPVREYLGYRIVKERIDIGIAGTIERTLDMPFIPPEASVTFQAKATRGNDKHKFMKHRTCEESTILTIDPGSFTVIDISVPEPDPELPLDAKKARAAEKLAAGIGHDSALD
jgi:hypothetical protein